MFLALKVGLFIALIVVGAILALAAIGVLLFLMYHHKNRIVPQEFVEQEEEHNPEIEELMASVHSISFNAMTITQNPKAIYALTQIPEDLPIPEAKGYKFLGWSMKFDELVLPQAGSKLEEDITLYAMWEMIPVEEENLDETDEEYQDEEELEENESIDEDDENETDEDIPSTVVSYDDATQEYVVIRYKRTYEGRMCLLEKNVKDYYDKVKNKLISLGLICNKTKDIEKFRNNKVLTAQLKPSGKSIALYLALEPKKFENTKYRGKDVSNKKAYQATPFLYKAKTNRKFEWMMELIDILKDELNLEEVPTKYVNYKKDFPKLTEEELIERGWLIKTVTKTKINPNNQELPLEENNEDDEATQDDIVVEVMPEQDIVNASTEEVNEEQADEATQETQDDIVVEEVAPEQDIVNASTEEVKEEQADEATQEDIDAEDAVVEENVVLEQDAFDIESDESDQEQTEEEVKNTLFEKLSLVGIKRSNDVIIKKKEDGIEAVGIVYNEHTQVYIFNPAGKKYNVGDVVLVHNHKNKQKVAVVVMANTKLPKYKIEKHFKKIEKLLYRKQ